jgi:hypothetical protein
MAIQSLYTAVGEGHCTVKPEGVAQGEIISNTCPTTLDAGQTIDISITCKNDGTVSGLFRLVFCASSPPLTDCGISSPIPDEFSLNSEITTDVIIIITMPNNPISYTARLQHKDGASWITDDTKLCDISLTSPPVAEAGGSAVLIGGLAIGALAMMMSKKK